DSTTRSRRRRNSSGDADATSHTPGTDTSAPNGAENRSNNPTSGTSAPHGADRRRVRLTWYTSPAAIASRMNATPAAQSAGDNDDCHPPTPGHAAGTTGGRHGRT